VPTNIVNGYLIIPKPVNYLIIIFIGIIFNWLLCLVSSQLAYQFNGWHFQSRHSSTMKWPATKSQEPQYHYIWFVQIQNQIGIKFIHIL
jgi:hypothetical protein